MLLELIKKPKLSAFNAFIISRDIYRSNSRTFALILLISWLPIDIILSYLSLKSSTITISSQIFTDAAFMQEFIATEGGQLFILYNFVVNLLLVLCKPVGLMAIALVTKHYILGQPIDFKIALKTALSKGVYLIPAVLIYWILTSIGMMLFIIPGLMVLVILYYHVYAIIIDDKTTLQSLKQSFLITNTSILKSSLTIGGIMFFSYMVSYGVDSLLYWGYDTFIVQIISRTASSFFNIIFVIVFTVIYLNRVYITPTIPTPDYFNATQKPTSTLNIEM